MNAPGRSKAGDGETAPRVPRMGQQAAEEGRVVPPSQPSGEGGTAPRTPEEDGALLDAKAPDKAGAATDRRTPDEVNAATAPRPAGISARQSARPVAGTDEPRTLLVANRGEIALRILRAARRLGLRTVCVHSEADRAGPWLALADRSVCIGPAPARDSYLNIAAILRAAAASGADLIHPGYGFLSESPAFAEAMAGAGLTLVGPSASVMRRMGDKVEAKRAMIEAGVPCVPGPDHALGTAEEAAAAAAQTGYPLIVKAAGGGGGRGMRVVRRPEDLAEAATLCRQEAERFFGNPAVYVEKFLEKPRHVEIQVMADAHGTALWLGARDCSLQRRHQKVIEESPAPGIPPEAIAEIGARCAAACVQLGYVGAGTFEFLYEDGAFNFIEMNTRIQVEHPVSEEVTGLDLVMLQIRAAMGERLPLTQADVRFAGHAIECRITAENPETLKPAPGRLTALHVPGGPGVRVDSHLVPGYRIPASYDSLVSKLITYGATRAEALERMRAALDEYRIEGCGTTIPLLRRLVDDPAFVDGGVDIHHLDRMLAEGTA